MKQHELDIVIKALITAHNTLRPLSGSLDPHTYIGSAVYEIRVALFRLDPKINLD